MGKCPSLITGNNGKPKLKIAGRKSKCKRCGNEILKGDLCVSIPKPGTFIKRTFCLDCLSKIIMQSRRDLDKLEQKIKTFIPNKLILK